ncbi:dehydrogenase [Streptomyces griseocarneus]|nr:dehydrogenase [Streptomyces griseocarneus]
MTTEQEFDQAKGAGADAVTVLGLGPMGRALAGALLRNGHPTTVWNRTPGKAAGLDGARVAETAAEAVAASPLVIVCVLDYAAATAVLAPLTDELRGRTIVNLTADSPDRARETAAWAAGRGIAYLDGSIMTPAVTIGTDEAVILCSGPEDVHAEFRGVLEGLAGTVTHLGTDPGRAAAYDVALLDLCWTTVSGYLHSLALARAEGITARELVPYAHGIVGLMERFVPDFAEHADAGEHPGDMSNVVSLAAGMDHVIHAARARGLDTSLMAAARATAQRAIDAGRGKEGISVLVEVQE